MKMQKVLSEKIERGHEALFKLAYDATIRAAAIYMSSQKIGAALIEAPDGNFAGIITERDVMNCCAKGLDLDQTRVDEVMTCDMVTADVNDLVRPVVTLMTRNHIRHIPLADNGRIVALISIRDIMHAVDEEKDITINELSDYLGCNSRNQVY